MKVIKLNVVNRGVPSEHHPGDESYLVWVNTDAISTWTDYRIRSGIDLYQVSETAEEIGRLISNAEIL